MMMMVVVVVFDDGYFVDDGVNGDGACVFFFI